MTHRIVIYLFSSVVPSFSAAPLSQSEIRLIDWDHRRISRKKGREDALLTQNLGIRWRLHCRLCLTYIKCLLSLLPLLPYLSVFLQSTRYSYMTQTLFFHTFTYLLPLSLSASSFRFLWFSPLLSAISLFSFSPSFLFLFLIFISLPLSLFLCALIFLSTFSLLSFLFLFTCSVWRYGRSWHGRTQGLWGTDPGSWVLSRKIL